ncbi:DUF4129 domain-containing protein [Bremerella cremea]|uniref:DUF4129 domain-containing protein n=1 Tax=Bremerella cremea TaxID=1031537 RepID=UPI0031E6ED57
MNSTSLIRVTFVVLLVSCLCQASSAQTFERLLVDGDQAIDSPVEQGREALSRLPQANWYDSESDNLRGLPIPGEAKMPDSQPGTALKPKAPKPIAPAGGTSWFSGLGDFSFASFIMYGMLIAVLGAICYLIFNAVRNGSAVASRSKVEETPLEDTTRQVDRVEHLPFEVKKKDGNLREEARRCYEAGNFNEAIVYLFSFQLLELDKGHVIRLAKGKTNGQYLREAGRNRELRPILQQTMNAFEDVFFGNRDLTRDRFERCWEQLPRFDQTLAGGTA